MASSLKASSHRILSAQRCSLIVALLNSQRAHNALQKSATWQEV
jgi:hypothetical protein